MIIERVTEVTMTKRYVTRSRFEELATAALDVSRSVFGFMAYLGKSNLRGRKYRDV